MEPVKLSDLNPEELKNFLDSFDHVFSDCDGAIWQRDALPRVGEFFELMKKYGKTVHFVSNNSLRSKEEYEEKFQEAGIKDGFKDLTIPAVGIAEYLKDLKFDKAVYSVACQHTTKLLESYGFKCKSGPNEAADSYIEFSDYFEDDPDIGAVVFDSDCKFNLAKLHKAVTYLRRTDVLFLCGATDKTMFFKNGVSGIGFAVFTDLAAAEVNRSPVVMSKPGKAFGDVVMKRTGIKDPNKVLFIGDRIEQDVGFGKACGFKTLLILTYIAEETMLAHGSIRPDYYAESLASIVPLLSE